MKSIGNLSTVDTGPVLAVSVVCVALCAPELSERSLQKVGTMSRGSEPSSNSGLAAGVPSSKVFSER